MVSIADMPDGALSLMSSRQRCEMFGAGRQKESMHFSKQQNWR